MDIPANVGVDNARSLLLFDRTSSELKGLKEQNFAFTITQSDNGQSHAEFLIKDNCGQILRRNVSKPFPSEAIQKKSTKLTKEAYIIEVKKRGNVILDDYF